MSTWEDVSYAQRFPEAASLPARVKVDPAAHRPRWLVDGEIREGAATVRPVTSRVATRTGAGLAPTLLGHEAMLTADDAQVAVAAATRAWAGGEGEWPAASFATRAEAVERFAKAVEARTDDIATLLMWEIGKPWPSARDEVTRSVEYMRNTLAELKALHAGDHALQHGTVGKKTHHARTERRPLGRVLCVAPFNYPVNEFLTTVVPALLMGNVVLAKTPRFGVLANMLLLEAFRDCFPRGVVSLLPGDGRVVIPALMGATEKDVHGNPVAVIDVLAFIGSEGAANAILKSHPVPITLSKVLGLGAKNVSVVLPGVDEDAASSALVKGALGFNGQRCTAEKLVFVHRSIAPALVEKLAAKVSALKVGMPWDEGVAATPLPEEPKLEWMRAFLDDAVGRGARVVNEGGGRGTFSLMRPAVVFPVKDGMRLFHEEQFGPLLAVAEFDDVDEVLAWQRRSPYGQQAAVWGPVEAAAPLARAFARFVARVNVNDVCQRGPDSFGFTATDKSGFGTLSLREALLAFSRPVLLQSPDAAALDVVAGHPA
ncbi:MAG: aldehyde dehydrogenase family protein [Myxococcota bacterium]|jgi:glyceraldehyde-3-phosphate dehydrogenase (NADP+)